MLLECTECELPYYDWEDLEEHYEVTHPEIHQENNRLDVRIIKRILNRHLKTYRCPLCFMPFPHPDLRDSHVDFNECDADDDCDYERDLEEYRAHLAKPRRSSVDIILSKLRKRSGSSSSAPDDDPGHAQDHDHDQCPAHPVAPRRGSVDSILSKLRRRRDSSSSSESKSP
ncbi:hypothetical protein DFH07DRAFT_973652 [Mycena maculata]|uniref:C2H2-type domain-containing protein n=1 Tax=Mycena maculata TaxID=230809 RepID=A0AAD7MI52_9AGAR|nr:hypothetical protein DFH07DRAFT_973652 [Mycena maculata]